MFEVDKDGFMESLGFFGVLQRKELALVQSSGTESSVTKSIPVVAISSIFIVSGGTPVIPKIHIYNNTYFSYVDCITV